MAFFKPKMLITLVRHGVLGKKTAAHLAMAEASLDLKRMALKSGAAGAASLVANRHGRKGLMALGKFAAVKYGYRLLPFAAGLAAAGFLYAMVQNPRKS